MSRTFRNIALVLGLLLSLSTASMGTALAQADAPDIEAIGEQVLTADPDDLLAALEEPIADRDLPDGFLEATFIDPDDPDATPSATVLGSGDLEGSLGSTAWEVAPDDDVFDGETLASVQFVLFDEDDFTAGFLDDFIGGAEGSIEGQDGASVEKIAIEGVDAALISFDAETAGTSAYVRYIAIPVGTVFVFVNVSTQSDDLDGDDVYDYTEALTLASITYMGTVLEDL